MDYYFWLTTRRINPSSTVRRGFPAVEAPFLAC
jgi:hypothetical protein